MPQHRRRRRARTATLSFADSRHWSRGSCCDTTRRDDGGAGYSPRARHAGEGSGPTDDHTSERYSASVPEAEHLAANIAPARGHHSAAERSGSSCRGPPTISQAARGQVGSGRHHCDGSVDARNVDRAPDEHSVVRARDTPCYEPGCAKALRAASIAFFAWPNRSTRSSISRSVSARSPERIASLMDGSGMFA